MPLRARVLEQLVARDAATGEVLWRVDTGLGEGAFAGPPVVVGDAVVIAFRSPPDVLLGVLDAATGALRGRCSVATARGAAAEKPGLLAAAGDAPVEVLASSRSVARAILARVVETASSAA